MTKKQVIIGVAVITAAIFAYIALTHYDYFERQQDEEKQYSENAVDKEQDGITIEDEEIPSFAPKSFLASDAGLIPNDESKARFNADRMIKVLNSNNKIVIDDLYYISTPSEKLTAREIEIEGIGNGELVFNERKTVYLFKPADIKSFILKRVKFTNMNDESSVIIVYGKERDNSKVEQIRVENCTFKGNISLYRQYGRTDINPADVDFGLGRFVFSNNKVENTKLSFIILNDIPVEYCEMSNNIIHNFAYTFLNLGVTNNTRFENALHNHQKYLKVQNNYVYCDDNWWGLTSSGLYYAFVLFEGDEVLYDSNHVEGLKTIEKFAVYDAYLNARIVNYTNNTWKNNICFAPDKTNNTLLKSKGGVAPLVRNYTGNTFIVEENFAERLGQPKDHLYVYFMSLTQHAESYNIIDNTFDVYELRFPASSMMISNFVFSGNTVKAKKSSGYLAIVRTSSEYEVETINLSNNTIDIGTKADQTFNLIKMVSTSGHNGGSIKKVVVTNNSISAPLGYLLYEVFADELKFEGNSVISTDGEYPGFAYRGSYTISNIADNNIISQNSVTFYEGRQLYGEGIKNEVLNITRNNYVSGNNGMHLDINYSSPVPTTYRRSYTYTTDNGIYEFYYTFTLSYNPSLKCAEVIFTNDKGETRAYKIGDANRTSNGNGQMVELRSKDGTRIEKSPYKVRFFNNADSAYFYISEYGSQYAELSIATVSYVEEDHQ